MMISAKDGAIRLAGRRPAMTRSVAAKQVRCRLLHEEQVLLARWQCAADFPRQVAVSTQAPSDRAAH